MKYVPDAAFVVAIHEYILPHTLSINLKWPGKLHIYDFNLEQFGKVLNC